MCTPSDDTLLPGTCKMSSECLAPAEYATESGDCSDAKVCCTTPPVTPPEPVICTPYDEDLLPGTCKASSDCVSPAGYQAASGDCGDSTVSKRNPIDIQTTC